MSESSPRRLSEIPPGYGLWSSDYVDGLRRERDDLLDALRVLRRERDELLDALRDLLASADASWYERGEGYDWREAVDRARRALRGGSS